MEISPVVRLSAHFTAAELACKCCGYLFVSDAVKRLLDSLEILRSQIGGPIQIVSGCRCLKHNREIGGAPNSRHLYGDAADLYVAGVSPQELRQIVKSICPQIKGIGVGASKFHIDARPGTALVEWVYR
jgi:uncharacterized protein YcbK (DUF882 family)